jgi:hypothetical protein
MKRRETMKSRSFWKNRFILFGMIIMALLFISGCSGDDLTPPQTNNYIIPATVLIVTGSTPYTNVVPNLTSIMEAAALTVTTSEEVPPGDLSAYGRIWDIRYEDGQPLTADDITSYTNYIANGGTLVVIGENTGFMTRNNSIVALISALGGGTITVTDPISDTQTVQPPFNSPNVITDVTFPSAAATEDPGTGAFITKDSGNRGAAIYYARGTLSNAAAGSLMVVFDVNWMTNSYSTDFQDLIDNMIKLP